MTLVDALATLSGRCAHGWHLSTQGCPTCTPVAPGSSEGAAGTTEEWSVFVAAIREATRADGTVRQNDIRPLIRGRIGSKSIGRLYKRAYDDGLLKKIDREPSTDTEGRNTHHDAGVYTVGRAA